MSHAEHSRAPTAAEVSIPLDHAWRKIPTLALSVAVIGVLASIGFGLRNPKQFFHSYLVAYLFFLSIALGALFFTVVQFAARAGWSVVVRRLAEVLMAALPLFIPLFVPIVIGLHDLYHWTHHDAVAHDPVLGHKAGWLNTPFFLARAAIFLGAWALLSRWYFKRSTAQDQSADVQLTRNMQRFSGPALIIYAFSVSYAALDWIMSLSAHWYSTIYGVYFFAGSLVAVFATLSILVLQTSGAGLTKDLINAEHRHDLGKLLFAFVVFWTYIAFSQYMLIWYGNLPEETAWYRPRWGGGWELLSVFQGLGHFVIPFFFLMSRHIKRNRKALFAAAAWVLAVHLMDLYWLVMPSLHPSNLHLHPLDLTTLLAVGGLFVFVVSRLMLKHPLIPVGDPRLHESIAFENA